MSCFKRIPFRANSVPTRNPKLQTHRPLTSAESAWKLLTNMRVAKGSSRVGPLRSLVQSLNRSLRRNPCPYPCPLKYLGNVGAYNTLDDSSFGFIFHLIFHGSSWHFLVYLIFHCSSSVLFHESYGKYGL